jgi:hypothetical protein
MFKKLKKTKSEIESKRLKNKYEKSQQKSQKKPTKLNSENLKNKSYQFFLNSNYWKTIREKIIQRDGGRCIICKCEKELQVHHDTYKNHFNEHNHLEDLMTLCKRCHQQHHYSK